MTDVPPQRPADEPGDEQPRRPESPTEPVGTPAPDETSSLPAGGVPASGQPYPGPPPGGDWTPTAAPRDGRLRRAGRRVRGSRVALAVIAVVVAAGLVLGGFAIADGGRDGKGERGRGAVSQRDGNGNRDGNNDDNNNDNGNGNNGNNDADNNARGDRGDGGRRGNDGDGRNGGNGTGNGNKTGNGNVTGTRQQVLGTVTAISATSITVRTSGGTPSYPLTANTPVTRGGSAASVADLKVGDAVVVRVVIASAGAAPVVERISAG